MSAILIDCEVNQLDEPEPIEVAVLPIWFDANGDLKDGDCHVKRFNPSGPIEPGAFAVHRILPKTLTRCAPSSEATQWVDDVLVKEETTFMVGHNVDFDADALGFGSDIKRICTLALARRAWPNFQSHKLGALIVEVMGMNEQTIELLSLSHQANQDVSNTFLLLDALVRKLEVTTMESLYMASERARVPTHWPFGKHKGEEISKTPKRYLNWAKKQDDFDPHLRRAVTKALTRKH